MVMKRTRWRLLFAKVLFSAVDSTLHWCTLPVQSIRVRETHRKQRYTEGCRETFRSTRKRREVRFKVKASHNSRGKKDAWWIVLRVLSTSLTVSFLCNCYIYLRPHLQLFTQLFAAFPLLFSSRLPPAILPFPFRFSPLSFSFFPAT